MHRSDGGVGSRLGISGVCRSGKADDCKQNEPADCHLDVNEIRYDCKESMNPTPKVFS